MKQQQQQHGDVGDVGGEDWRGCRLLSSSLSLSVCHTHTHTLSHFLEVLRSNVSCKMTLEMRVGNLLSAARPSFQCPPPKRTSQCKKGAKTATAKKKQNKKMKLCERPHGRAEEKQRVGPYNILGPRVVFIGISLLLTISN